MGDFPRLPSASGLTVLALFLDLTMDGCWFAEEEQRTEEQRIRSFGSFLTNDIKFVLVYQLQRGKRI